MLAMIYTDTIHGHYSQFYIVYRHLNNVWYKKVYWLIGLPHLAIIASKDFCILSFAI